MMPPGSAQTEHMLTQPRADLSIAAMKEVIDGMETPQLRILKHYVSARLNEDTLLLKLPPEMRNHIYAYVIEQHLQGFFALHKPASTAASNFIPPLFEVSRQLRSEGLSLLFADYLGVTRLNVSSGVPPITPSCRDSLNVITLAEAQELYFKPVRDAELMNQPRAWAQGHGYDSYLLYASEIFDDFNTCLVYRPSDTQNFRTFRFRKTRSSREAEISEA